MVDDRGGVHGSKAKPLRLLRFVQGSYNLNGIQPRDYRRVGGIASRPKITTRKPS